MTDGEMDGYVKAMANDGNNLEKSEITYKWSGERRRDTMAAERWGLAVGEEQ